MICSMVIVMFCALKLAMKQAAFDQRQVDQRLLSGAVVSPDRLWGDIRAPAMSVAVTMSRPPSDTACTAVSRNCAGVPYGSRSTAS